MTKIHQKSAQATYVGTDGDASAGLRAWFTVVSSWSDGETETAEWGRHEDGVVLDGEGYPQSDDESVVVRAAIDREIAVLRDAGTDVFAAATI